jgi:uncharacterized protein
MIGRVFWTELMTTDVTKARAFYTKLMGWTYQAMPGSDNKYWLIIEQGNPEPLGGLMQFDGDEKAKTDLWFTYFAIADVTKAVMNTKASGGEVLREPFDIPGVGRIAIIQDPTGAVLGVMTPAAKA